jgi:hypothetical protein
MQLDILYSIVRNKGLEDGIAYIVTGGAHLIEAQLYGGVIINVKSRTLSHDQIVEHLLAGDVKKVDVSQGDIKADAVQAGTIRDIFRASSQFVLTPGGIIPRRLFKLLRLLGSLAPDGARDFGAFDIITAEIMKRYANFSLDRALVRKRMEDFSNEFLIAVPSLDSRPMPADDHYMPGWILESVVMPESQFKDILIHYICFGEMFTPVLRTSVKKESGIGAKMGFARMSKTVYGTAAVSNNVVIFKGMTRMGDLHLTWHSENKSGILVTQADIEKLDIKDGDTVSLVLNKK